MKPWQDAMRAADVNGDGSLSFLEFQDAIKMAEEAVLAAIDRKEKQMKQNLEEENEETE